MISNKLIWGAKILVGYTVIVIYFFFLTFRKAFVGSLSCFRSLHVGNTTGLVKTGAANFVIFSLHFLTWNHLSGSVTWYRYMKSLTQISLFNQFHVRKNSYLFCLGCFAFTNSCHCLWLLFTRKPSTDVSPRYNAFKHEKKRDRLEDLGKIPFGVVKAIHSFLSVPSWYRFCITTLRKMQCKWRTRPLS